MIVLDTHAWPWWRAEPRLRSARLREAIGSADRIGISAMSCFEVARLADDGRVTLATDPAHRLGHAVAADRIIFASALAHGAPLGTKDRRIRSFDAAATVW